MHLRQPFATVQSERHLLNAPKAEETAASHTSGERLAYSDSPWAILHQPDDCLVPAMLSLVTYLAAAQGSPGAGHFPTSKRWTSVQPEVRHCWQTVMLAKIGTRQGHGNVERECLGV